jgi:ATP/maltotriose-dependent transcriptional regulator MalT
MSILIDTSTLPSRIGVPSVPLWAVPRQRLAKRLDAATGLLTMISAPEGAGKTIGVASWAWDLHPSVGVVWMSLPKGSDGLPLDQISAHLARRGRTVLVCDDFPAEPSTRLIQDLEVLLSRPDPRLSIILICSTSAMVPTRLLNPHGLATINFDDLVMDENEVRLALDQQGVKASGTTIRAVLEHTGGWAAGVGLVATTLAQLSRSTPWGVQQAWPAMTRSTIVPGILPGAGSEMVHQVIESREFGEHASFLTSASEPGSAGVDRWHSDDHVYGGMIVVPLTARETDVLRLLAQHCSNEEIAADLVLSLNTIKTHMRSLFQKLSVSRRADAVRRGRALGLC